jgi:predicted transcriptional regulator
MRFDPELKAALDKAAKADRRTVSSLVMKILEDWLKEKGWLK